MKWFLVLILLYEYYKLRKNKERAADDCLFVNLRTINSVYSHLKIMMGFFVVLFADKLFELALYVRAFV